MPALDQLRSLEDESEQVMKMLAQYSTGNPATHVKKDQCGPSNVTD